MKRFLLVGLLFCALHAGVREGTDLETIPKPIFTDGPFFPPDPYCPPDCPNDPEPPLPYPAPPPVPPGCGYTPTRCS